MIFPDAAFQIFPPEPSKSQGIKGELLSKTLLRKNDSCNLKSLLGGIGKNIHAIEQKVIFQLKRFSVFDLQKPRPGSGSKYGFLKSLVQEDPVGLN